MLLHARRDSVGVDISLVIGWIIAMLLCYIPGLIVGVFPD